MAGEIIKTKGIVLEIHPWSRTSHVTTWLTPDHGVVTTLVKGAVRSKSAFLGQYDLYYECDLLYYSHPSGELHALREVTPTNLREGIRGNYRKTALAGYAAFLARELTPSSSESRKWFSFADGFLDRLANCDASSASLHSLFLSLETDMLSLAGLSPDFSGADAFGDWAPFAIDLGKVGEGGRTVRISRATVAALKNHAGPAESIAAAERFLGLFISWHLDRSEECRRTVLSMI